MKHDGASDGAGRASGDLRRALTRRGFAEFYRRTRKRLLYAAYGLLGDWQRAEDVTQELFLKLLRKICKGQIRQSPWAWIQTAAYYRCIRLLGPAGPRDVPTDERNLRVLVERVSEDRSPGPDMFEALSGGKDGWDGLVYWTRRFLDLATLGARPRQKERLAALLRAGDRHEALAELRRLGDRWSGSSASMAIARFSARLDKHLERIVAAGPRSVEEKSHWSVLLHLKRRRPARRAKPAQNTLSWLIQLYNGLEPEQRRTLVTRVLGNGTGSPGEALVAQQQAGGGQPSPAGPAR
jgi:DNA-directed RNA polymerase specialized sigma24 family protein